MISWEQCWKGLQKCEQGKLHYKFVSLIDILHRFLLITLNIEAILGETSLAGRKKMLQKAATTGVDLDNVYAQTLQQIRDQKGNRSKLGMEVLMWISHAERPLRIDELCHALAVDMESTDLDRENIPPQDTVLGSCLGLAVVDPETSTIRLIHYTLQEYLSRPCILPDAHKTLGQKCLTYLNYNSVRGLPANGVPNRGDMPFLEYSSLCWGSHAKIGLSDQAKSLALELLNQSSNHISATLLLSQAGTSHSCSLAQHVWPGLHCAAYFGIVEVVAAWTKVTGCAINQRDCVGFTALMWAARQGNEGVVRLLLMRNNVNPDKPSNEGETPLWWASQNGHEGVVKLLLTQKKANPDKSNDDSKTPLWAASRNGHEGVVKLLLARNDVNPDKPNEQIITPLSCAAGQGHEGVVKLLLARSDVKPDKPNVGGETPLWRASNRGHEGVVELLLARDDVDPDKPTNDGRTPLWQASFHGREVVVKLLLARNDVNPDKPNEKIITPLSCAAGQGHEGVVKLLLARNDVKPDKRNVGGKTPLWLASNRGHEGVVQILLARNDVNPDEPNDKGETPLWAASHKKHEGVVNLLKQRCQSRPAKKRWRNTTLARFFTDMSP